jgi:hypothetical protein
MVKANGKCKMSLIIVVHILVMVVSAMLFVVNLLVDIAEGNFLLTIIEYLGFVGMTVAYSCMVYVWSSIFHFAMKTANSPVKAVKKRIMVVVALGVLTFLAGSVIIGTSDEDAKTMAMAATLIVILPALVFACYNLVNMGRLVQRTKVKGKGGDAKHLQRQSTGLQRSGTGLQSGGMASRSGVSSRTGNTSQKRKEANVIGKLYKFATLFSVLIVAVAALLVVSALEGGRNLVDPGLLIRVIRVVLQVLTLFVVIFYFNGLVSSAARLNTKKRLRSGERSKKARQDRLERMKTGLEAGSGKTVSSGTGSTTGSGNHSGSTGSTGDSMDHSADSDTETSAGNRVEMQDMSRV